MKKILGVFLVNVIIVAFTTSCEKRISQEKELYEVLNFVYPLLTKEIPPPEKPPQPPLGSDSLGTKVNKALATSSPRNLYADRKQIIAIKLDLEDIDLVKPLIVEPKNKDRFSINQLVVLNVDSLKINRFNPASNDSLVAFDEGLLESQTLDYLKFDKLLSFSKVIFNRDYNRAVLIGAVGTSGLATSSHLIFLKKTDGKWEIIETQLLEIS